MSTAPDPPFVKPMLWALAALAAISLAYGARTAVRDSADLERRAQEAAMFRARLDPYTDPDATYPPSALPVFAAIVLGRGLPQRVMWLGFNLASLMTMWGIVLIWGKDWPRWATFAFMLVMIACKPTRAGLGLGQFHVIPLAAILASEWDAARNGKWSGFFVGIALLKPTMSLPYLFVLAAKRRWTAIGVAAGVQVALFAFSCAWLGVGPVKLTSEWLDKARSQLAFGTIDIPSLLGRASPSWTDLTPVATAVVLVATGVLVYAWRDRSAFGLTALTTFSAAIMTYHRHYDLVLVLPALAYLIDSGIRRGRRVAAWSAIVLGMALIVPSDGRLIGPTLERAYDVGFVIVAYATLVVLLVEIATESTKGDAGGPSLA